MGRHIKGQDAVKVAAQNGLTIKRGKGDHVKIEGPAGRGYMIVYDGELSIGVECKVKKWFKSLGIVLGVLLTGILIAAANGLII